ncbi:MAG: response regulator [Bryobacteraceae bacterium]|nr:response regulator [Bryobacteraceae bacterium]
MMDNTARTINVLVIEDSEPDVYLIREALRLHVPNVAVEVVEDGEKAIRIIDEVDRDDQRPCPDILLLDLHLPRRSGEEALERFRRSPRCGQAPVLAMSSSESPKQRARAEELGASFFRKPSTLDEFLELGRIVRELVSCAPDEPGQT